MQKAVCPLDLIVPPGTDAKVNVSGHEEILALALAVAASGSRATLLDAENRRDGTCGIVEAAQSGRPFFVRVRPGVLALDFDDPAHLPAVDKVLDLLRHHSVDPVVQASGREGHRHVLAQVEGKARLEIEQLAVALTGSRKVLRETIRPPLSPHREGREVSLLEPSTAQQAVSRLGTPGPESPGTTPARLSDAMWRLLVLGTSPDRPDDTRSETEFRLMVAMVNRHWSEERGFAFLSQPSNKGGAKIQEIRVRRGEAAAWRHFRGSWAAAQRTVAKHPAIEDRQDAIVVLAGMRETALSAQWSGAAGVSIRMVLVCLLDVALKRGSLTVEVSTRQLADVTGLSRPTSTKYLSVLLHQGLLRKVGVARGEHGHIYKFQERAFRSLPMSTTTPEGCVTHGQGLTPNHPAFSNAGGLGKNGLVVLEALAQARTSSEVESLTGISPSTAYRCIRALVSAGLVRRTGETWVRESDPDALGAALDRFALDAGVSVRAAKQRAAHKVERVARAAWFANTEPDATGVEWLSGWRSTNGMGFWPRGDLVTVLPGDTGYVGYFLLTYSHQGEAKHLLASRSRGLVHVVGGQVAVSAAQTSPRRS